jgi:hypothetical protein
MPTMPSRTANNAKVILTSTDECRYEGGGSISRYEVLIGDRTSDKLSLRGARREQAMRR